MDTNYSSNTNPKEDFHLRSLLENYLIHLHWFVLSIAISSIGTYTYLRYTIPQYQASTSILVKDDKKGGMLSELSAFADMGIGKGSKGNIDNEIEILKSRTLVESTVRKLKLNIGLFAKGKIISVELYKDAPITVDFINTNPDFFTNSMAFDFLELSSNTFTLNSDSFGSKTPSVIKNKKVYRYGELISIRNANLIITKSSASKKQLIGADNSIKIVVNPIDDVIGSYFSRLKVAALNKTSSVVSLTITDPVMEKAEDFLDNLILVYNNDAAADKNFISENTSKFIANRLILITQELDGVELDVERFKTTNNIADIESEAKLFMEGAREYNKKGVEIEIQLNVITSLLDFMKKSSNSDLLPSNLISGQGESSGLISSYNQLILERNRILKSATLVNPSVVKLDQEISSLKTNVVESLGRLQSNLNIEKRNLRGQEGLFDTRKGKIPVQERQFRVIARQQKVKEELYLYLLKKREETAITMAATEPNARVIDSAKASKAPVAPKKNVFYLAALLIGILVPFGIIYLIDLLDTKVKTRSDITNKFSIPFLGDIPRSDSSNQIMEITSRSATAEAMRIVRTNLDFMLNQVDQEKAKTIFMTSTIPGEGKTFLSVNLAAIYALSGKKVLLIGMDIRNPKLPEYFGLSNTNKGLTNYLSSNTISIHDCIIKAKDFDQLYILPSGSIPPNPTELLMNDKIETLFTQFKKEYDYIVVDTAPVSLVSDTLIIAKHADTFVYVVRANYLDKRMLNVAEILHREHKLPNMALLLNDTYTKRGYGYSSYGYGGYGYGGYGYGGYGYGYGATTPKKSWFQKIFNR
jgi:capsular exopolysaccharide synthesis family protein